MLKPGLKSSVIPPMINKVLHSKYEQCHVIVNQWYRIIYTSFENEFNFLQKDVLKEIA